MIHSVSCERSARRVFLLALLALPASLLAQSSRPALPEQIPDGRAALRVMTPGGPAEIDEIISLHVFVKGGMRWSMGPKPKVIDRYADGWVTVDKSSLAAGHEGMRTEMTVLSGGAALTARATIEDRRRVEYRSPVRPTDVIDLSVGPAAVAADEVAGRVVGPDGKPVAGAVVSLPGNEFPDAPPGSGINEPYRSPVTTDADGVFRFGNFARQWFLYLRVEAPGYATRRLTDLPVGKPFTVRLDNKTRLAGHFMTADGKPAGHTAVQLLTDKPTARPRIGNPIRDIALSFQTDAEGSYDVPIEPGVYDVRVASAAGAVARHQRVEVISGNTLALPAELGNGETVRVRAVDSLSGKPIAGVHLGLEEHRPGARWTRKGTERVTLADGTASWEHIPEGPEAIQVQAAGYSRWWLASDDNGSSSPRAIDSLRVDVKAKMEELVIKLEPAVRVSGRVLAPDGSPVANAMVDVAGLLTGDARYMVSTDAAGRFTLTFPNLSAERRPRSATGPSDQYAVVAFDNEGHWANVVSEPFTPKAGESHELTLRMTAGGRVRGRVVDPTGRPVAGIEVEAAATDQMDRNYYNPRQLTDADGHFDLGPMRPTTYMIQADNNLGGNIMSDPPQQRQEVTVAEGMEQNEVVLTYTGPAPGPAKDYFRSVGNRRIRPATRPATP